RKCKISLPIREIFTNPPWNWMRVGATILAYPAFLRVLVEATPKVSKAPLWRAGQQVSPRPVHGLLPCRVRRPRLTVPANDPSGTLLRCRHTVAGTLRVPLLNCRECYILQ